MNGNYDDDDDDGDVVEITSKEKSLYNKALAPYSFVNVDKPLLPRQKKHSFSSKRNKKTYRYSNLDNESLFDDQASDEDEHSSDENDEEDMEDVGEDGNITMMTKTGEIQSLVDPHHRNNNNIRHHREIEIMERVQEYENMKYELPDFLKAKLKKQEDEQKIKKNTLERAKNFMNSKYQSNKSEKFANLNYPQFRDDDKNDDDDDPDVLYVDDDDEETLGGFITADIEYITDDEDEDEDDDIPPPPPKNNYVLDYMWSTSTSEKQKIFYDYLKYTICEQLDPKFITAIQKHQNGQAAAPSHLIFETSADAKTCLNNVRLVQSSREMIIGEAMKITITTNPTAVNLRRQRLIPTLHYVNKMNVEGGIYRDEQSTVCAYSGKTIQTSNRVLIIKLKPISPSQSAAVLKEEEEEEEEDDDDDGEEDKKFYCYVLDRYALTVRLLIIYIHWSYYCIEQTQDRICKNRLVKQKKITGPLNEILNDGPWMRYMWLTFSNAEMYFVSEIKQLKILYKKMIGHYSSLS